MYCFFSIKPFRSWSPNFKRESKKPKVTFSWLETNKKVWIAQFDYLIPSEKEREIQIYQKIDFIQTLLMTELKKQNKENEKTKRKYTSSLSQHPNLKIGSSTKISLQNTSISSSKPTFPHSNAKTSQNHSKSHSFHDPGLLQDSIFKSYSSKPSQDRKSKHLNLNRMLSNHSSCCLNRDLKEPEIYNQRLYNKNKRKSSILYGNYQRKKQDLRARSNYTSFSSSLGRDSQTRIRNMSYMLNPYKNSNSPKENGHRSKAKNRINLENLIAKQKEIKANIEEKIMGVNSRFSSQTNLLDSDQHPPPYQYDPYSSIDKGKLFHFKSF